MCENEKIGSFVERDSDTLTIEIFGQIEKWKSLKYYEFNSDRKLMTRVVKNLKTGRVLVFCKGADSSIIDRSIKLDSHVQNGVNHFANLGFRTLTFGYKSLANDQIDGVLSQEDIE